MIYTLNNLPKIAQNIRRQLKPGIILSISGPLGIGKTTLIKHILPEFQVASPSFLHMLTYDNFVHIDAYTFQSREAFLALGIEELLATHCVIIEWGELVADIIEIFDATIMEIKMEYDGQQRTLSIS